LQTVRLTFSKTGEAKYLSHLDLMRCFTRAVRQCGYPVWYTEGFNPHIYLMFSSPLSLGFESECETVDLRLLQDDEIPADLAQRINKGLPQGVRVTGAALPVLKHTELVWSEWEAMLPCDDADAAAAAFAAFLDSPTIEITKKTKKGALRTDDVKPLIKKAQWEKTEEGLRISLVLSQRSESALNPAALFEAFSAACGVDTEAVAITRTAVYSEKMEKFQ